MATVEQALGNRRFVCAVGRSRKHFARSRAMFAEKEIRRGRPSTTSTRRIRQT
jgi:hypothetical protein